MQTASASPTGRRRITARMLVARATRPTTWEPAKKGQALSALKRAAPALGLPSRVLDLIDYLVGRTQEIDWTEGARPIAWPSNATLQDVLGLERSQVKTVIRVAHEHDLFEMDDSPNGQRYGIRGEGRIIEAYGFDLTPLIARRAEFEAIAAAHQERRREGGRLRGRVTAIRNQVLALTDAAQTQGATGADWPAFAFQAQQLAQLRGNSYDPAQLAPVVAQLTALHELVRGLLLPVKVVETDPMGSEDQPLLNTPTTHLKFAEANTEVEGPSRPSAYQDGGSRSRHDHHAAVERKATKPGKREGVGGESVDDHASALRGFVVTPDFLLQIAPAFRDWLATPRPSWENMVEAADLVRSDLGISLHAWGQACVVLRRREAVTMLAVISAGHAAGRVKTPGAYLRKMVELHQAGELYLDKTLFGLADELTRRHGDPPPKTTRNQRL